MKILQIISKSITEHIRSIWILILTVMMAPFFIFVYYLILESSVPNYTLLYVNQDQGSKKVDELVNYGDLLIDYFNSYKDSLHMIPFSINEIQTISNAKMQIKKGSADAVIIIPEDFSISIATLNKSSSSIEFIGNLTSVNYLVTAVWANEIIHSFLMDIYNYSQPISVIETAIGSSGIINEFDLVVPGILILSLIMLMFPASIAFINEVEHKTLLRLKLSHLSSLEYICGLSAVQLLIGILSLSLTLISAILLGFNYSGSLFILLLITTLCSFSIIAFSLIIAAFTKSANEVLVIGNFPMFLFMFFTGAAFPLKSSALFTIGGYSINIQSIMSPSHAISALNKTLILDMSFFAIIPEILSLLFLTLIYFLIGAYFFNKRHMNLK